jgi:lipopolysaccharide biosynthesis glycosyltransferase
MRDLVVALDDDFVVPFRVVWRSLVLTNSLPTGTALYVLHGPSLSTLARLQIEAAVQKDGFDVSFVAVPSSMTASLPLAETDHVSIAAYYRLFVHVLLPPKVSSVVYLDLDIVVVRSIRDLFEIEVVEPLAAVDHALPAEAWRLWGPPLGGYFQTGVLVINVELWRDRTVTKVFEEILRDQRHKIRWWDQDVLNLAFADEWQRLPVWYNVHLTLRSIVDSESLASFARLIHFAGLLKPWNSPADRVPDAGLWHEVYYAEFGNHLPSLNPPPKQVRGSFGALGKKVRRTLNRLRQIGSS